MSNLHCIYCASAAIQLRHEEDRFLYGLGPEQIELVVPDMPVFFCTSCGEGWTDWTGELLRLDVTIAYLKSVDADQNYIRTLEKEREIYV